MSSPALEGSRSAQRSQSVERGAEPRPTATVFGLDVHAGAPISFLQHATAQPTGRELELELAAPDAPPPAWPESARVICEELESAARLNFRIEAHPEAGYRLWGPGYGCHVLSGDGRRLVCTPEGLAEHVWQRFLIAQVLPFAALLHGLEVFHASAVVREQQAVAFMGPSRSGKTSVALELCRLGAEFLADDVLALEAAGAVLSGHPGTPIAGLDHAEARRSAGAGVDAGASAGAGAGADAKPQQRLAATAREQILRVPTAARPAPLGALFLLDRRPDAPGPPRFERVHDALPLLTATFNFVLATPERLRRLLDVCALAARVEVERVVLGPDVDASQLALAVESRLASRR